MTTNRPNCISETTLISTEAAVIYLYPYTKNDIYSDFKLKNGEYYACIEDERGGGELCSFYPPDNQDDSVPIGTLLELDGYVKARYPVGIENTFSSIERQFRGEVAGKTVWISDVELGAFQSNDFAMSENDAVLAEIGYRVLDGENRMSLPYRWLCQ